MTTLTDREQVYLRAAEAILRPLEQWAHKCHQASIMLMNAGDFEPCRVARGGCKGVGSQHSWLVLCHPDTCSSPLCCYDEHATIIDPTLWSYRDDVKGVWVGTYEHGLHTPHGKGSIWNWGRPDSPHGPVITLKPRRALSRAAQDFLDLVGPLDREGWELLAHAPVEGWPSAEIIDAIYNTKGLEGVVPIDIVGMLTDRNPGGLYLPEGTGS